MSGAGDTDRAVWREFFDPASSTFRTDALLEEFIRIWGKPQSEAAIPVDVSATEAIVADEAERLEELSLDQLLTKYAAQRTERSQRPPTRVLSARAYDRNPLVIAIGRMRASHQCEIKDCSHPRFKTFDGVIYTEVHHIVPLADGGEDTIENVACLCAAHHREVHLGERASELTVRLKDLRAPLSRIVDTAHTGPAVVSSAPMGPAAE